VIVISSRKRNLTVPGKPNFLRLNLQVTRDDSATHRRADQDLKWDDLMLALPPLTARFNQRTARASRTMQLLRRSRQLEHERGKGADIILNALRNQAGCGARESSGALPTAKLFREDMKEGSSIIIKREGATQYTPDAPEAPPPPPPPPELGVAKGVNMMGSQSEIFYEGLFGVNLHFLESVSGVHRWRIEHLNPVWLSGDAEDHRVNDFYIEDCYLVLFCAFAHVTTTTTTPTTTTTSSSPEGDSASASGSKVEANKRGETDFRLHYWIGSRAGVEKKASVCFAVTQLNAFLGGRVTHHCEEQYSESPLFLSYFTDYLGIVYNDGGTPCHLRRVEEIVEWEVPRLYRFYRVSPTTGTLLFERARCRAASLSHNDVYLLDTGGFRLYLWNGARSDGVVQYRCRELALLIGTKERKSKARLEILDGKVDAKGGISAFWDLLEGVPASAEVGEAEREKEEEVPPRDYHYDQESPGSGGGGGGGAHTEGKWEIFIVMGANSGNISVESLWKREAAEGDSLPSKDLLKSTEVLLLDFSTDIYVYHGSKCPSYSRQIALFIAEQMASDTSTGRPGWATVHVIKEKREPILFKARFANWLVQETAKEETDVRKLDFRSHCEKLLAEIRARGAAFKKAPKVDIDVRTLLPPRHNNPTTNNNTGTDAPVCSRPHVRVLDSAVEMGILNSGRTFVKIAEEEQGHFFSGETYVIIRSINIEEEVQQVKWVIYFWEGLDSSTLRWPTFLLGLYPLLEQNIALSGGFPTKERIWQQKEPPEFSDIFSDRIIFIHKGNRYDAAMKGRLKLFLEEKEKKEGEDGGESPHVPDDKALYEAKQRLDDGTVHLVEVPLDTQLHSGGTFLLLCPQASYVWSGRQSSRLLHRKVCGKAKQLQQQRGKGKAIELVEGNQSESAAEFWALLGGERVDSTSVCEDARLVRFYYDVGVLKGEEVAPFSQKDLVDSLAYMLDSGPTLDAKLYVWFGSSTVETLRESAWEIASKYREHILSTTTTTPTKTSTTLGEEGEPAESDSASERKALVRVEEGLEPLEFTRLFRDWTRETFVDPYEERMKIFRERERLEQQMLLEASPMAASCPQFGIRIDGEFQEEAEEEWREEHPQPQQESMTESRETAVVEVESEPEGERETQQERDLVSPTAGVPEQAGEQGLSVVVCPAVEIQLQRDEVLHEQNTDEHEKERKEYGVDEREEVRVEREQQEKVGTIEYTSSHNVEEKVGVEGEEESKGREGDDGTSEGGMIDEEKELVEHQENVLVSLAGLERRIFSLRQHRILADSQQLQQRVDMLSTQQQQQQPPQHAAVCEEVDERQRWMRLGKRQEEVLQKILNIQFRLGRLVAERSSLEALPLVGK